MTLIAPAMSVILGLLALLHIYWGFGGFWPGTDGITLARTVAGFKGIEKPPAAAACFAVALVLLVAAVWPLLLAAEFGSDLPGWLPVLGGLAFALVFTGRGIIGYLPGWRRRAPELPFARFDQLYYSPLCLALGLGFFALLLDQIAP